MSIEDASRCVEGSIELYIELYIEDVEARAQRRLPAGGKFRIYILPPLVSVSYTHLTLPTIYSV